MTFSGIGEPLLHKRAVDAVAYGKQLGMHVRLTTNGSLLGREIIEELISTGLDDLSISLNAGSSEEYGAVHANQEDIVFRQIMDNLIWLNEYKKKKGLTVPHIHLSHVVSNLNSHRAVEMMESGVASGAVSVNYRPLHTFPHIEKYALGEADLEKLRSSFIEMGRLAEANGIDTNIDEFEQLIDYRKVNDIPAPCIIGWVAPFVLANGDVMHCVVSREVVGNINETSFEDIWMSPSRKRLNGMALRMHRTGVPVPNTRCEGCERMLQNTRILKYLWPLWGKATS